MRRIGFSTGALALGDFRSALRMLEGKAVDAIELSALRQRELEPLIEQLDSLALERFEGAISFHAPSEIDDDFEPQAVELLRVVAEREWPIVIHPDVIRRADLWRGFGSLLAIENMDKRKPIGRTSEELDSIFQLFPDASMCFDIGHSRQVDPSMSEASSILHAFSNRIVQLHISEVNTQSRHDPISYGARLAFNKVSHLVPDQANLIIESRVPEDQITREIDNVLNMFPEQMMVASD